MANGGIIGPPNPVCKQTGTTSENITTFTASGTFTAQANQYSADILLVAGGGGGGSVFGGGGGGGGLLATPNHPIPSSPVPIIVGSGGSGYDVSNPATNPGAGSTRKGNDSVFGGAVPLTACGGGGGGGCSALDGGSGGGHSGFPGSPSPRPGGSGVCGQGNAGGAGACAFRSGGGGGAGAAGSTKPNNCSGGDGGAGATNDYASPTASPSNTTYAGGGGGGARSAGPYGSGGSGGGGRGMSGPCGPPYAAPPATYGSANTGGGGGSVGEAGPGTPPITSGNGGSGIVVIREQAQPFTTVTAPGVWKLNEVYENVKDGNWSNT